VADGRRSTRWSGLCDAHRRRAATPDLFVALVAACRYCGLLQHSLAAYERATRLDPNVKDERAAHPVHAWGVRTLRRRVGTFFGHREPSGAWHWRVPAIRTPTALARSRLVDMRTTAWGDPVLWVYPAIQYFGAAPWTVLGGLRISGPIEGLFYQAPQPSLRGRFRSRCRDTRRHRRPRFYPYQTFASHAWLDALRERQDFKTILQKAETSPPPSPRVVCGSGRGSPSRSK
jgi:hypothetical protein